MSGEAKIVGPVRVVGELVLTAPDGSEHVLHSGAWVFCSAGLPRRLEDGDTGVVRHTVRDAPPPAETWRSHVYGSWVTGGVHWAHPDHPEPRAACAPLSIPLDGFFSAEQPHDVRPANRCRRPECRRRWRAHDDRRRTRRGGHRL